MRFKTQFESFHLRLLWGKPSGLSVLKICPLSDRKTGAVGRGTILAALRLRAYG